MFRDVYADRYEVRVRFTDALMWKWEIWDLRERKLVQASSAGPDGRFLSSRDAHHAGCERASAFSMTAR
jgi:hypothetical protein